MRQQTVFPSLFVKCLKAMLVFGLAGNYAIAQPVISSLSTLTGIPGSSVTISGSNFNDTAANDIVFFGAAQATVTSASSTSLTVTVPMGAIYQPVSVLNTTTGLTGYSASRFLPTYNNAAYAPGTVNFDTKIDSVTYGNFPNAIALSDLDGDGKIDVIGPNFNSGNIYIYKNASTSGTIAFGAIDTMTSGANAYRLSVADVDGDGKPDIVVPNRAANTLTLYRNTSTSGSISFASTVTISTASQPNSVAIGDIDGDGRPDLVVANQSGRSVSIFRNTGAPGSFSFAARINYSLPSDGYHVAIGDIDGDGKPDIAVSEGFGADSVCVFRNTSTPGTISLAARQDFITPSEPLFAGLSDLDGDGKADMVTVNLGANNFSAFMNTSSAGTISFASRSDFAAGHATGAYAIGDMDGDGKPDVCLANGLAGNVSVYLNTSSSGAINFASTVNFPNSGDVAYIAVGDIDGDGMPDMAIANQGNNKVSFYRNDPLHAIVGATSVCAGSTITLTDATSGGSWKSSNSSVATVTAGVVTGVAAGTATITYSGTAGRSYTGNIVTQTVTVNALPTVSAGANSAICTGSSATLTATGATSYTWSPSTGLSATTGASITASPTSRTTYTVTGTDINGCVNTAAKTVSVNALPTISAGANVAICSGSSATMTASGGSTYSWSPSTGLSATTGTSVSANPASTITYTVTGTNANGCVNTAAKTVTVNALPTISAGANTAICSGSSATVSASGGATYTWSPSTGLAATTGTSIAANPTLTIVYTVTGTDLNGCKNKATQTVTVNPLPAAVSVSGGGVFCNSATITATGGAGGTIYFEGTTSGGISTGLASASQAITSTGTYYFRAQSTAGCWGTQGSAAVTINPLPSSYSVTGGGAVCAGTTGATIGLSGTSAGISYKLLRGTTVVSTITGSGSSMNFTPQSIAGTYTATATNTTTGCAANMTGSATVLTGTYPTPAIVSVTGGGGYCSGGTGVNVGVAGSAVGINYQLYRGTTAIGGPVAGIGAALNFGLQTIAGTYTVVATNPSSGCFHAMSGSTTVHVYPVPAAYTVTGGGNICAGSAGVHVGLSGSATGVSYKLFRDGTPVSAATAGTGAVLDFGAFTTAGTYTITGTNSAYGCVSTMDTNAVIAVNPVPVITGPSYSLPVGSTVTMLATPSDGVWSSTTPAVATIDSISGLVTGVSGGSDLIRYTLSSGCSASYIIKVMLSAHRGEEAHATTVAGDESISLAPNPNNGVFTVKGSLKGAEDREVAILITNMAGQVIYTGSVTANGGVVNATVQLNNRLPRGLYQLVLRSANESRVLPVVIGQ